MTAREALVGKPRAKLTVFGRQLIVESSRPAGILASAGGPAAGRVAVVRVWMAATLARRRRRRPPRPLQPPPHLAATPRPAVEQRILTLRAQTNLGPHQLSYRLGIPRSTIYAVLARDGVSRVDACDQPTGQPVRYVRTIPASWSTSTSRSWAASPTAAAGASTAAATSRVTARPQVGLRLPARRRRRRHPRRLHRGPPRRERRDLRRGSCSAVLPGSPSTASRSPRS